jgi:hypothetical protein
MFPDFASVFFGFLKAKCAEIDPIGDEHDFQMCLGMKIPQIVG